MAKAARKKKVPIDALRALSADPNQVEVRVGGRTVATLLRQRAVELGLVEGGAWTPALAARVDAAAAESLAREAALAFLAKRAWSAAALEARLVKAGHVSRAARNAIRAMLADGWLDDHAFATARVEHHRRRGSLSEEALSELLQADGVGEKDAADVARSGAATAAEVRLEVRRAKKAGESAKRVAGKLARRGFDPDTIQDALEHAGYALDE